jgi:hypothetical protein
MNAPSLGRVTRLSYRDRQPNMADDTSVLVVEFRAPDAKVYEHELPNPQWMVHNTTLQFMALNRFKPSDIDGTSTDVEPWRWTVPIVHEDGKYQLAQAALSGGESALRQAEWFGASDDEKSNSGDSDASGGGSDNGGSPNGEKTADEADEQLRGRVAEGDVGVEIIVD